MGFKITIGNKSVLNLGDSLLLTDWQGLRPTVLMLPIGGVGHNTWTMDADDARLKREVEALGKKCSVLGAGDAVTV